ncbi:hypothetical protein [Methylophilus sp. YYY-1]|uniref:hypothetical protein n=1 Tax=Methylophilus sp. YYY-1 TaxID=2682087 RepID=UPI0023B2B21D|nr:hypothetical protein [Methylophilus sp. YYY-1]MDF0376838.1 hypothetical protein [Methylophilus sp. YYY-1]
MKNIMIFVFSIPVILFSISANAVTGQGGAGLTGVSVAKPVKNTSGEVVEATLPDPFAEFDLVGDDLFDPDQLKDIVGSAAAIVEDRNGKTNVIWYGDVIRKDSAKDPEIKATEYNYDSYLLDVKSAASLGVPFLAGTAEGNYKVEYRFYKGASCKLRMSDIDPNKFKIVAKFIREEIANTSGLTLKGIKVVSSVATLNTAYSVLKGTKADAKISGPGWQVGGMFYASQTMQKNKVKLGINLTPYFGAIGADASPSVIKLETSSGLKLPSNQAVPVSNSEIGITDMRFKNIIQLQ